MDPGPATRTLGVVVVHEPGRPVDELPSVRGLLPQVDELLIVGNGMKEASPASSPLAGSVRFIAFPANRGTAAAWNAAIRMARKVNCKNLYILDQDSTPFPNSVKTALAKLEAGPAVAVVQPPQSGMLHLVPFPWDTVASGSLYDVETIDRLGGFDERLFVDEVDHELLARLIRAGYVVAALEHPTIEHEVGSPRPVRILGRWTSTLGHTPMRQRLRGFSNGLLIRRYFRDAPRLAGRLIVREAIIAGKSFVAGESTCARAFLRGFVNGASRHDLPTRAAERTCPYCAGPLLGRFAEVPDWRFGAGAPADVYRCASCGALAAGRVPSDEEVASWYGDYYTHGLEPPAPRLWSRLWPTPSRRREMAQLRRYFTPPGRTGRLLDVGTGAGERLVEFAGAGWDVVGQDLDPEAGRLAKARGLEVLHCPVVELVGREGPFDLIGLTHVLEHAVDPGELLQACAALLAPDGRLCVISPNARSAGALLFGRWWFGLEQPRHLGIPTLDSLQRLTERVGLVTTHAATVPTNAAVILGGSLARPLYERLPAGPLHRVARFASAFGGQALGRLAFRLDRGRGEEVVWVGRRRQP